MSTHNSENKITIENKQWAKSALFWGCVFFPIAQIIVSSEKTRPWVPNHLKRAECCSLSAGSVINASVTERWSVNDYQWVSLCIPYSSRSTHSAAVLWSKYGSVGTLSSHQIAITNLHPSLVPPQTPTQCFPLFFFPFLTLSQGLLSPAIGLRAVISPYSLLIFSWFIHHRFLN